MLLKNHVLSFQINKSIRGSLSRLSSVAYNIIKNQKIPNEVQNNFSEGIALTSLFVTGMENENVFNIHLKGEGLVKTIFFDINNLGSLRGYIKIDKKQINDLIETDNFFQNSVLAITTKSKKNSTGHQGIIPFTNNSLRESIQSYFNTSEAANTVFKTFNLNFSKMQKLKAEQYITGAIMIKKNPNVIKTDNLYNDDESWEKVNFFLQTLTDKEFLDKRLSSNEILMRVFGEFEVRVFEEKIINNKCKCSKEKIIEFLNSLKLQEINSLYNNKTKILFVCQFCNKKRFILKDEISKIFKN